MLKAYSSYRSVALAAVFATAVLSGSASVSAAPLTAPRHVWVERSTMPYPLSDMSATTVGDAIYLVGGCVSNQTYDVGAQMYLCGEVTAKTMMYHPSTDVWTELSMAPKQRYRHAAAANGHLLYVFGGRDLNDVIVPEVDVFNTVTQTWSVLPNALNLPTPVSDETAFAIDGVIYVAGGYDGGYSALTTVQTYTPGTGGGDGTWGTASPLQYGRGDVGSGVIDGKAYVFGGFTHTNNWVSPLDTLEVLGSDGVWTVHTEPAEVARGDKAIVPLHDRLLVLGGETKTDSGATMPLDDIEAYDPTATSDEEAWELVSKLWAPRFRFMAASYGDSAFVFGGQKYVEGTYNAAGSYYPLADDVVEFHEHGFFDQSHAHEDDLLVDQLQVNLAAANARIDELEHDHGSDDHADDSVSMAKAALAVACVGVALVLALAVFVLMRRDTIPIATAK